MAEPDAGMPARRPQLPQEATNGHRPETPEQSRRLWLTGTVPLA